MELGVTPGQGAQRLSLAQLKFLCLLALPGHQTCVSSAILFSICLWQSQAKIKTIVHSFPICYNRPTGKFSRTNILKSTDVYLCFYLGISDSHTTCTFTSEQQFRLCMVQDRLASLTWPLSVLVSTEALLTLKQCHHHFSPCIKNWQDPGRFCSCSFIHIPMQQWLKWTASCGKVAVWF